MNNINHIIKSLEQEYERLQNNEKNEYNDGMIAGVELAMCIVSQEED